METKITIRLLDECDSETYRTFKLLSLKESPLSFSDSLEDEIVKPLEAYKAMLSNPNPQENFVLGAFDKDSDELIGSLSFKRDNRTNARFKGMIHVMYVHPDHRGKNVGSLLVSKLFEYAAQMEGLEQIHLWVLKSGDSSAIAFYSKLGFLRQDMCVKKDLKIGDDYVDAEYMVKYM